MPGTTSGLCGDNEVIGLAESTLSDPPNEFVAVSDYFNLGAFNNSNALIPLDEMTSGSFEVAFDAGDDSLSITFHSNLVVNAGVEAVPEPSSLSFVGLGMLALVTRRRTRRTT